NPKSTSAIRSVLHTKIPARHLSQVEAALFRSVALRVAHAHDSAAQHSCSFVRSLDVTCYALRMPIRVAVICGKCERIYLVAHPDSGKRIQFIHRSGPHPPYLLTCTCKTQRFFDRTHTLPYGVSDDTCSRGYADRGEYYTVPSQIHPESRGS